MFWNPDIGLDVHPAKVVLKRGEFVDESRRDADGNARIVPYKIYYPENHPAKSYPTIIWSHGFGGNRDGASFLSRYIASHGYVVVHPTHIGTDSSLWEGKPGHPWDILRQIKIKREDTLERFRDIPFVLDQLHVWAQKNPGSKMDLSALGMSGHSFGAMTTQAMAGMKFPDMDNALISLRDDRFQAGIVYSPVPIDHISDEPHEALYGPIDIPLLHMTGTEDESPLEGYGYEHRRLMHDHTDHPESYWLVKEGGDHMVYNGTRGKLKVNPLKERHEEIIKAISLAFWEAKLRGDQAAQDWLAGQGAALFLDEDAWLHK